MLKFSKHYNTFHRNRTEENRVMQADRENQDLITEEGRSFPSFQPT